MSRQAPRRSKFTSARIGAPAPMWWRSSAGRTLQVTLSPPALVRPNTTLKMPVKLGGLNPGEDAKIVVAAVDVGILNLTNYKPPAPDDYYLGQRRLTSEIRDLYGQLIDGMQG